MAQRKTLTEVQVDVLRWIGDGSPAGDRNTVSARISAAALRNRGMVTISGRGPTWSAAITPSGREYLQRVDGPNPPAPRQANTSVTQQLVEEVVRAGGSLRVPRRHWGGRNGIDYERRARLAEVHGKVPPDKRLVVKAVSPNEWLIELVDAPPREPDESELASQLAPVPVPTRLTKYHPVAQAFRDRTHSHEVSRKALSRTLRIVHALALEADQRGHTIACADTRNPDWKPTDDGQIAFTINGHRVAIRIWEKGVGRRGPYEEQLKRWHDDRDRPYALMRFVERPKAYDSGASGELNIQVLGASPSRQSNWGDRSRWRLEDRLPHLLREIEMRAKEAEERRIAKEREDAERQAQWEAAMGQAKLRAIEAYRIEVLTRRVRAWEEADAIRAYCDAVEVRHGAEVVDEEAAAREWLAFAREYADRMQQLPRMPADPELTHDRLKPFLGRWSPFGPHSW